MTWFWEKKPSRIWALLERMKGHPQEFSLNVHTFKHEVTGQEYWISSGNEGIWNGGVHAFNPREQKEFRRALKEWAWATKKTLVETHMDRLIGLGFGDEPDKQ